MNLVISYVLSMVIILQSINHARCKPKTTANPQVLMVSFDGFRWDYLTMFPDLNLPNFGRLKKMGVYSPKGNLAPYVTKTFPSHYTAATGLYIESHGIVANSFFDKKLGKFSKGNITTAWWDQGEPIWITTKKHNLKSGTYFWPGSGVKIHGVEADYSKKYEETIPFEERVDTVLKWLEEGINMVASYYHEPDATGHKHGPNSKAMRETLKRMDKILGKIVDGVINSPQLKDKVNVLITSDHGMGDISKSKSISIKDHVRSTDLKIDTQGTIVLATPQKGKDKHQIMKSLGKMKNIKFYLREDVPIEYHYANNDRVSPIVGFPDYGWTAWYDKNNIFGNPFWWMSNFGNHGWSRDRDEMKPIFFAFGPGFKKGIESEPFETVNYYPLMCHLLGIKPAPNNGSLDNVKHLLNSGAISPVNNGYFLP